MGGILVEPRTPVSLSVSLVGVAQTEATRLLFEAASLAGDPNVLTMEDAMGRAFIAMIYSDRPHRGLHSIAAEMDNDRCDMLASKLKEALKSDGMVGFEQIFRNYESMTYSSSDDRRDELQKQARRFMKDAKALVEVMKVQQNPAPPKTPQVPRRKPKP